MKQLFKQQEKEGKLKIKYPKVRNILKVLYSRAYLSGKNPSSSDGYDYSSAYKEIEEVIELSQTQTLDKVVEIINKWEDSDLVDKKGVWINKKALLGKLTQ